MILDSFRYLLAQFKYPEARKLGLLNSSLMIAERRKQARLHWQFHLERTKEEQRSWAEEISPLPAKSILVLGAGRLFDVNLVALSAAFSQITFSDADPLSIPNWRKAAQEYPKNEFNWEIKELSGAICLLRDSIKSMPASATWEEIVERIRQLPSKIGSIARISDCNPAPSAILSLNLLSQIPVLWQDILLRELRRRFSAAHVRQSEAEWLNAFAFSARALVEQHLRALAGSGAENLLLITDLQYLHYRTDYNFSYARCEEAPSVFEPTAANPVGWKASSKFATDGTLDCEINRALYGVDLEDDQLLSELFPAYQKKSYQTWLWHIRPKVFSGGEGVIHRVGAFQLTKKGHNA